MTLTKEIDTIINMLNSERENDFANIHKRAKGCVSSLESKNNEYSILCLNEIDPMNVEENINIWPGHIRYTLAEQIEDNEKMLYEQLISQMSINRVKSDAILNIAPKYGNAFLLCGLGLECTIMDDMLENSRLLDEKEIYDLTVAEELQECLYIKKAINFIEYAKNLLPDCVKIGLCFMMSPYDLAYLIRGSELMIDMYENPELVHFLMQKCTELYIRSVKLLKKVACEPDDYFYYLNKVYRGANIIAEDCVVMLPPTLYNEFVMPYNKKIFNELGPCWIHFCGDGSQLLDSYCNEPGVLGIQYGQLHLNKPVDLTIAKHLKYGKGFGYGFAKLSNETYEEYFERLYRISEKNKYIIFNHTYQVGEKKEKDLMAIWHKVQNKYLYEN